MMPTSQALRSAMLGAAAGVLLVCALMAWQADRALRSQSTQAAGESARALAWSVRESLDSGMANHYEQMRLLSELDDVRQPRSPESVRRVLDRMQASFPQFAWIGLADMHGTVQAATGDLLRGHDVSARPWFKAAQTAPFVGDVHPALLLEKLLPKQQEPWRFVDIALPLADADGHVVRVLGAHLSWDWARGMRRTLNEAGPDMHEVQVLVVDKKGVVLLGPAGEEGKPLDIKPMKHTATAQPGYWLGPDPKQVTGYAETQGSGRYPGLGWTVLVRQPLTGADDTRESLLLRLAALAAAAAAAATAAVWLAGTRPVNPS